MILHTGPVNDSSFDWLCISGDGLVYIGELLVAPHLALMLWKTQILATGETEYWSGKYRWYDSPLGERSESYSTGCFPKKYKARRLKGTRNFNDVIKVVEYLRKLKPKGVIKQRIAKYSANYIS